MANQVEQLRAQLLQKAQNADQRYRQYDASIIDWAFSSPDAFFSKDASSEAARRRIMNEYPEVYDYIDAYYQTMRGEDIYQAYSKSIPPEFKKKKQAERMHEAQGKVMQGLITTIATIHGLGGLASMGAGLATGQFMNMAGKATGQELTRQVTTRSQLRPVAKEVSEARAWLKKGENLYPAIQRQAKELIKTSGNAGQRIGGLTTQIRYTTVPKYAYESIPYVLGNSALAATPALSVDGYMGDEDYGVLPGNGKNKRTPRIINGAIETDENGEIPTVASDQPLPDYVVEQAEKEHQIRPITVVQQQTPEDLDHLSFGEAFATARRNKLGAFIWRGTAYNTALKSDPTRDTAFQDPRRDPEVIAKSKEARAKETAPIAMIPSEIAQVIPEASLMEEPNIIVLQDQLYSPEPTKKQQRKEKKEKKRAIKQEYKEKLKNI